MQKSSKNSDLTKLVSEALHNIEAAVSIADHHERTGHPRAYPIGESHLSGKTTTFLYCPECKYVYSGPFTPNNYANLRRRTTEH